MHLIEHYNELRRELQDYVEGARHLVKQFPEEQQEIACKFILNEWQTEYSQKATQLGLSFNDNPAFDRNILDWIDDNLTPALKQLVDIG
jgi:predicted mannosyl-3-phosphoglycerate phosphatase (HAD superfamily)